MAGDLTELRNFVTQNQLLLTGVGATLTAIVGWALTYFGWSRTYKNSLDIENNKFAATLSLESEKYNASLNLEKRRAELKFVSEQIQFLYGPLFSLGNASRLAFKAFSDKHAPDRDFVFDGTKMSFEELRTWRLWMTEVMMPLNLRMEKAIIENSHLIDGPTMPASFQDFLVHVASYKAVLKNWEDAKVAGTLDKLTEDDHVAVVNFPTRIEKDINATFAKLRQKQLDLLSITKEVSGSPSTVKIDA